MHQISIDCQVILWFFGLLDAIEESNLVQSTTSCNQQLTQLTNLKTLVAKWSDLDEAKSNSNFLQHFGLNGEIRFSPTPTKINLK